MSSWWDTVWGAIPGIGPITEAEKKAAEAAGIDDAMGSLNDTISFSKAVWLNVSDFRMWRSLGWLILGIVLMILGLSVWLRRAVPLPNPLAR